MQSTTVLLQLALLHKHLEIGSDSGLGSERKGEFSIPISLESCLDLIAGPIVTNFLQAIDNSFFSKILMTCGW